MTVPTCTPSREDQNHYSKWPQASDIRVLAVVGETIVEQFRQNGSMLEFMMKDDALTTLSMEELTVCFRGCIP